MSHRITGHHCSGASQRSSPPRLLAAAVFWVRNVSGFGPSIRSGNELQNLLPLFKIIWNRLRSPAAPPPPQRHLVATGTALPQASPSSRLSSQNRPPSPTALLHRLSRGVLQEPAEVECSVSPSPPPTAEPFISDPGSHVLPARGEPRPQKVGGLFKAQDSGGSSAWGRVQEPMGPQRSR